MRRTGYIIGFLLCMSTWGHAQQGELVNVKVLSEKVKKNGSKVNVRFTLDLTDVEARNQESIRIYPAIVAKDGSKELELAPVIVEGKTRRRVHKRMKKLTGKAATDGAYTVMRHQKGKKRQVIYVTTIPYEPWLTQSRFVLREQITGCLDCEEAAEESSIKDTFLQLFQPNYAIAFVEPTKEEIKMRDEVRVARLQFRRGSYRIEPYFQNNQEELNTVTSSIELVKTNTDLTITGIYITGYASPEANAEFNQKLSKNRAEALAAYAQKNTKVDAALWHVNGKGEDWEGLRKEIEKRPTLPNYESLLNVIDQCNGNLDECEQRLKSLMSSEDYQFLLSEIYDPLRRNEYRIEYSVRNFNLEEAKAQLKTHPDLLSVQEIYTIAHSYGKGSEGYNEAMLIATATYPNDPATVVNGACVKMEQGDLKGAIEMLELSPVRNDARVLNALGVAYAKDKQYEHAKFTLQKAYQAGSTEANTNLEQLEGVMADL